MAKRKGKKWRHVYPYTCLSCGKDRIAFKHERAAAQICTRCESTQPHKDQGRLFAP